MPRILVERAGLLTTVQDLGRAGHQHAGVPAGGAMDDVALRLANLLVGNAPGDAALECTLDGPTLRFESEALVAVTGAALGWHVDGRALLPWRSARVPAGGVLSSGIATAGCRGYLAVRGGLQVPAALGSRATLAAVALGGHEGRALRRGDVLDVGDAAPVPRVARRGLAPDVRPWYGDRVRVVAGTDLARLDDASRDRLFGAPFRVSSRSDRMGVRLEAGDTPLACRDTHEALSAGVAVGTVQLPPGGAPIVLMADRQTTGGYPRLGEVATVDLPVVAQRRPGDALSFEEVSLAEAQALYLARERELDRLARVLALPA